MFSNRVYHKLPPTPSSHAGESADYSTGPSGSTQERVRSKA